VVSTTGKLIHLFPDYPVIAALCLRDKIEHKVKMIGKFKWKISSDAFKINKTIAMYYK
jgi:hypothetical protein